MADTHPMIEARGLTKRYGELTAIKNVTFELNRGEILGFLGPNGAGKTTTMKILTCFISPTSGSARVNGHDVFDESLAARQGVGYLPESAPLYKEMSVLEDLQFFAEMRSVAKEKRDKAIRRVVDVCGLGDVVGREIRELSKGYRQRVGLAQAMVHDPDILILDEPTSGLDPNQIVEIRGLIKELGKERTIILSTHNLPEVQATCSRVIIINKGRIAADGTVEELTAQKGGRRHSVVTRADEAERVRAACEKVAGVHSIERGEPAGDEVSLVVVGEGDADLRAELAKAVVESGAPLLGVACSVASLENIFRGLTVDKRTAARDEAREDSEDEEDEEDEAGNEDGDREEGAGDDDEASDEEESGDDDERRED